MMDSKTILREQHFMLEREPKNEKDTPQSFEVLDLPPRLIRAQSNASDCSMSDSSFSSLPGLDSPFPPTCSDSFRVIARPRMTRRERRARRNRNVTRAVLFVLACMLYRYNQVADAVQDNEAVFSPMGMVGLCQTAALFWCFISWQSYAKEMDHGRV